MNKTLEKNDNILVAEIINRYTLVINKGEYQGVENGQRYLIYEIGEEILDPTTKKTLGKLELVKGTGKIVHTQENIATISSDMKSPPLRSITRKGRSGSGIASGMALMRSLISEPDEVIEELPAEKVAFDNPQVGDIARKI